ncbi:MAG TPA: hypothetical protein VFE60_18295 [Roseiarcus sp.]|jgi:hypothetical protein|nr:hypothetical protein [Roseiarcus sp.]
MARNGNLLTLVLWLASAFVAPAFAQSTNAAPDISMNDAVFEPANLPGLPDAAKQAAVNAAQQMKSGEWLGYVLVSSPDFSVWRVSAILKTPPVYSVSDTARAALETCEYDFGAPCYILSINGHDTQKRGGGWASQPEMLFSKASEFDERTVPFVSDGAPEDELLSARERKSRFRCDDERGLAVARRRYRREGNRDSRRRLRDVVVGANCLVYAVNNRVVFDPR